MPVVGVPSGAEDLGRGAQVEADHLVEGEDGDAVRSHGPIIAEDGLRATHRIRPVKPTLAW
ncbi:hypothetical protein GCM10011608_02090 [Micromonospora sonchi]|uniref:Uncharacterized protein n=1 Tax=Micromonospora sonchi TaxID=1763543 RepID=A0A917WQN3_9ACTN|nr:hypothetical protein GCM10011608_02090 [Micromonospora sonchi]